MKNEFPYPSLLERAEGLTLFESPLVVINEDFDYFSKLLHKTRGSLMDEREFNAILTLNHESIHFISILSQAFTYSYSVNLRERLCSVLQLANRSQLEPDSLHIIRDDYDDTGNRLLNSQYGVSAIELLEAMAITESFRMSVPNSTSSMFNQAYKESGLHKSRRYGSVINSVETNFGFDAAYHLTPRICFLALNGDDPGHSFQIFIEILTRTLNERKIKNLSDITTSELCYIFGMSPENSFLKRMNEIGNDQWQNPLFRAHLSKLSSIEPFPHKFELMGRPGDINPKNESNRAFLDVIVPPLILFNGGRGLVSGIAKEWSKEFLHQFTIQTGIMGICERLLEKNRPYICCPHEECPFNKTALCHKWFSVPRNMKWTECAFPKYYDRIFKMSPDHLMDMYYNSWI